MAATVEIRSVSMWGPETSPGTPPIVPVSCGGLVWRFRGQTRVTAIVKASFSLVPGDVMSPASPEGFHDVDVPWGDRRSLWAARDRVPFRLLADVVLVGHAHLPPGGGSVRLCVFNDEIVVDRSLIVRDDPGEGAPVALAYEHAFGGPDVPENPVGTGAVAGSAPPRLIDPADPRRPASFGPVARAWPARARLLGAVDPTVFEQPIPDVPSEMDWAFFQAAPPGQVADFLRGDEWVRLEGMNPDYPVLASRLPGTRAVGRVYGLPGKRRPVTLGGPERSPQTPPVHIVFRADDLHVDADRLRATLTYRASFSVPGEEVLPELMLLAGVELPGQTIAFPAERPAHRPRLAAIQEEDSQLGVETLPFTGDAAGSARQPDAQPGGRRGTVVMEAPQTTPLPPPAATARRSTVLLEWPAAPAPPSRQPTILLQPEMEGDNPLMGTIAFSPEVGSEAMTAPFHLAEPGQARSAPSGEIPGAPWASRPAAPVPRATGAEMTTGLTLDPHLVIPDDLLADLAHLPTMGGPERSPQTPPVPRRAPAPPVPAMSPPPQPREIRRPAVKASLRARFDALRKA